MVRRMAGPWYSICVEFYPVRWSRVAFQLDAEYGTLLVEFALVGFFGHVKVFRPRRHDARDPE